ncbi:hypothetical protein [Celerinatantimonas yamalensis]|uniref:Xaa-Pro dipeptidase N-terminal domain-containing protein n=1 Tax=Celerinatantimonas yamalensis TaxID=559956 RepID=A0ABW9G9I4_9GAMM
MEEHDGLLYRSHIEQLQQRCAKLLQAMSGSLLVIHAGHSLHQIFAEQPLPFVPSAMFRQWLAGIDCEHAWIVTDGQMTPQLFLLQEHFQPCWEQADWWPCFSVQLMRSAHDIEQYLPHPINSAIYLGPHPDIAQALGFEWINPELAIHYFHYHRANKTDYELFCLSQAALLAKRGMQQVHDRFFQGASGLDIYLSYLKALGRPYLNEPAQLAFNQQIGRRQPLPIGDRPLAESNRHSLWFNAGAQYRGYQVQIGRCFGFRRGHYSDMVQSFDGLLVELIAQLRLGRPLTDIRRRYQNILARWLVDWELVQTNINECVQSGLIDKLSPLPLYELVGLSLPDPGAQLVDPTGGELSFDGSDKSARALEPKQALVLNMAVFFNPYRLGQLKHSVYAELLNWPQIEMLQRFGGIALSDTLIVNADGVERITADSPL